MIQSMTAFANTPVAGEWGSANWEVKTVNHRYLDVNFKLPESFRVLEQNLRDIIKKHISRGKIDCYLKFESSSLVGNSLELNYSLIDSLMKSHQEIGQKINHHDDKLQTIDILRWPGVVNTLKNDLDSSFQTICDSFEQTLQNLVKSREKEGEALLNIISQRIELAREEVVKARNLSHGILELHRKKLLERITELKLEVDEQRIAQELVYLAQKIDIDEELDRLDTHLNETQKVLSSGNLVGRKLDFLMQELNREANTLGSKSIDSQLTNISVELKVLIEQMREQIQNIQ